MRKPIVFHTAEYEITHASIFAKIKSLSDKANFITKLIHQKLPAFAQDCHCGAIDNEQNMLVIYVSNNSAFYSINNQIEQIEDILKNNAFYFDKILIKINPSKIMTSRKNRSRNLSAKQVNSFNRLADAINRPDMKIDAKATIQDKELVDDDWIKL